MLSSLQECPEEVGGAQDRGCPGWGCAGQGGDAQGICTFFSHLSWRPCLAGTLCHGGPSALLVQAAMPGAAEGGGPHCPPGHGADWPSAVAVAVPGPMAGPGLQLVPPCKGIILLNPSERHHWMRLEPPSGSPISPGAENSAGGGTAAILGREASVPPATCLLLLGPQPSQHCSCTRAEGQQNPGELSTRSVP